MGIQWKIMCGLLVIGVLFLCGASRAYALEEKPDPEPEKPAAEPDKPKGDTGPDVEPGRPRQPRGGREAGRDPRRPGREGNTSRQRRPRMPRLLYAGLSEEQQKVLEKFGEVETKFIQTIQEMMVKLRELKQEPKKEETPEKPEGPEGSGDKPDSEGEEEGEEGEEGKEGEEAGEADDTEEEVDPKEALEQELTEKVKEYIKAEVEMHENMIKALKKLDTLKAKTDFWKAQLERGSTMRRGNRRGLGPQRGMPGEGRGGRQRGGRGMDRGGQRGGERGMRPRDGERPTPPPRPENPPEPKPDGGEGE